MENMVILGRSKRSGEQLALFEEPNVTASLVPFPARQGTWDVVVNTPPPPTTPSPHPSTSHPARFHQTSRIRRDTAFGWDGLYSSQ